MNIYEYYQEVFLAQLHELRNQIDEQIEWKLKGLSFVIFQSILYVAFDIC